MSFLKGKQIDLPACVEDIEALDWIIHVWPGTLPRDTPYGFDKETNDYVCRVTRPERTDPDEWLTVDGHGPTPALAVLTALVHIRCIEKGSRA